MNKPSKSWESGAFNRETNEWDVVTLHSYDHSNDDGVKPVNVKEIELDTRRPRRKRHKELIIFSDAHIGYRNINGELEPMHDEQAMLRVANLAEDLKPDYVVNLGDTLDFSSLSRFAPDSNHHEHTLQPSMQRAHDFLADVAERTPGAERHMVEGNHDKRLGAYVLKNAAPLAELKDGEYPALSLPALLKLGEIGWRYHGGYGAAEYEYEDDLAFIHGNIATKTGTAHKLSQANPDRNIVQGHKHSIETVYRTDRKGRQLGAFVVGTLCRVDGVVPSAGNGIDAYGEPVKKYENWQQGIMVVKDYGGRYEFNHVPIHEDGLYYNGKRY